MLFAPTPVALYTSEVCLKHEPGWFNPERPERLSGLLEAMRTEWSSEFAGLLSIHEPESDATPEQLLQVHTPAHLARLDDAFGRVGGILTPRVNLDADTIVSAGTQAAARRAAGLVVAAVDEVFGASPSGVSRAFVMVRPPGHHAEPDRAMGFCLYNNVMVGAAHAQAAHGVGRVAVLDFDVHHGNGCAAACWADPSRLYASTHQKGIFPAGVSAYTPAGSGRAGEHGQVLSHALPAGSGSEAFREAWAKQLLPAVRAFEPEAIFLSTGFDAHAQEEVASLALRDEDFAWITAEVAALGLPTVSVLEGGYNLGVLKRGVRCHLDALIHGHGDGRC